MNDSEAAGKYPADPATVQLVYEGIFRRIMAAYPLDYYWLWTPEGWTWEEVKQEQIDATLADFQAVQQAAAAVGAPFQLATCGWVLGAAAVRPSLFDSVLPKSWPMSCINRNVGHEPVEAGFAAVARPPEWAIPWLEDDPALILPQLWVGRMRKDAADALRYGCDGLLGIHWRTRILGPERVGAGPGGLVAGSLEVTGSGHRPCRRCRLRLTCGGRRIRPGRAAPCEDFYADWAAAEFGPRAGPRIGPVFARLDCRLPASLRLGQRAGWHFSGSPTVERRRAGIRVRRRIDAAASARSAAPGTRSGSITGSPISSTWRRGTIELHLGRAECGTRSDEERRGRGRTQGHRRAQGAAAARAA